MGSVLAVPGAVQDHLHSPLCGLPSTNPQPRCVPCLLAGAQCAGIAQIPGSCAHLAAAAS